MIDEELFIEIIPGYEISNKGRLFTTKYFKKRKEISPTIKANGYLDVKLSNNGIKHHEYIHRLVAKAFIPNPNNLPEVNHIDGNKRNNNVDNLEWCSRLDNMQHYFNKKVNQLDKNGTIINTYPNCRAAAVALGQPNNYTTILQCAKHDTYYKTALGYKWEFVKE